MFETRRRGRAFACGTVLMAALALARPVMGQYRQPSTPPATPTPSPSRPTPPATTPSTIPPATKGGTPQAPAPNPADSIVDRVIKLKNTTPWTLNIEVRVSPQQLFDSNRKPTNESMKIESAAVVFPLPKSTAGSEALDSETTSELSFNGKVVDSSPKLNGGYPAGTRLLRWEMRNQEGRNMILKLASRMKCSETVFDEKLAMTVPWPAEWPEEAASCFKPTWFLDYRHDPQEKAAADALLGGLLQEWLKKADPKSMPPARLAKILMGKVLETVNPNGDGQRFNQNSSMQGLTVQFPVETLRLITPPNARKTPALGTELDIAQTLTAMCRVAGLPARTVIGWDVSEGSGSNSYIDRASGREKLRAWTEFALVDPPTKKVVWVPMDPVRQRKNGSRAKPLDRPWEFFGNNEELDMVMPIAFQLAPPTTVAFHGSPAFWGWLVTPEYPQADQAIRFTSFQTAARGDKKPPGK
ncbi:MAG: transglutaminase-like domain-containing protein [Phycisphaerales bacterium]